MALSEHFRDFLGETEHFCGKNGALRWIILGRKHKHNVQKPTQSADFIVFTCIERSLCLQKINSGSQVQQS